MLRKIITQIPTIFPKKKCVIILGKSIFFVKHKITLVLKLSSCNKCDDLFLNKISPNTILLCLPSYLLYKYNIKVRCHISCQLIHLY